MFKQLSIIIFLCFSFSSQAKFCLDLFKNKTTKESTGVLNPAVFQVNDIRGVFLRDFDFNLSKTLGKALVSLAEKEFSVSEPKFLIGYDARVNSPELAKLLSSSLVQNGASSSVVGLVPTPLIYFLLHHYNYTAGIIITASHNPVEYNGFKVMFNKKYKKYKVISKIKDIIEAKDFLDNKKMGQEVELDPFNPYIDSLKKEFPHLKPVPFVVDSGNGATGPLVKKVFKALGLNPHYLYTKPDGTFPNHHPNPMDESTLVDLKNKVVETNSVFGVGFDGDGDRLAIVTPKGRAISSDEFAYMFLPTLLSTPKISKILVADVKVSDWYYKGAEKMGAKLIMSETGYSFLIKHMEENQASLAMELSGHIMFNDRANRGFDDALYNTLRFIELIEGKEKNIEKLLPKINTVKTNEIRLKLDRKIISKAVNNVKAYLDNNKEAYENIDGIRVSREHSWGLVRSSNTEELLSLRFEARNKKELFDLIEEFSHVMNIKIPEESLLLH